VSGTHPASRSITAGPLEDPPNSPNLAVLRITKVKEYSCLILALSATEPSSHFDFAPEQEAALRALSASGIPVVAVVFCSPYTLAKLPPFSAIVVAYENEREAQEAAADVLLGKLEAKGKLPVSLMGL